MTPFKDKVAIVTGGASGIGRGLCELLGQKGAVVIVADADGEGAHMTAAKITEAGGRASGICLDVCRAEQVQKLIEGTAAEYGRLDFMFNNAGVGIWGEARDMSLEHWRHAIDVNLWSVVYGSTVAYSVMVSQGFGHIVNTASLAGLVSVPAIIPYATAKHAVVGLSTSLRAEAADLGVRVSVVCPGAVRTHFHESLMLTEMSRNSPRLQSYAMDSIQAAGIILRGVVRNRNIIIFPLRARLTWIAYRLLPAIIYRIARKTIRKLRAARRESSSEGAARTTRF